MPAGFYSRFGKRWFDVACTLCGLIVLSPVFLIAVLAIRLSSRGPAFFTQVRVGRHGKLFRIFKFRTMRVESEGNGSLLTASGDSRVTPLGNWLRRTKMDELPQLINVLAGDMSLVGPRPEVPKFVAVFTDRQRGILREKPGITGPCANIYLDEEELLASQPDKEQFYTSAILPNKLEIDLTYCEHVAFAKDLRIIFQTYGKVFGRLVEPDRSLRSATDKPQ
jgi:lipopolysaccharide/colanic/teichoic acid biosynthesis glycosyltransferase